MRWTIRRAEVWHGQDGYTLVVSDTAWWALAISATCHRTIRLLDHPCCGRGLGKVDLVLDLAFSGVQWAGRLEWAHTTRLAELPVDEDIARVLWLGDWDAWQATLADDVDEDS